MEDIQKAPQADLERGQQHVTAIESRRIQLGDKIVDARNSGTTVEPDHLKEMAERDAADFKSLVDKGQQSEAAVNMSMNSTDSKIYKERLAQVAPDVAEKVKVLDRENDQAVSAKDDRKREDMENMRAAGQLNPEAEQAMRVMEQRRAQAGADVSRETNSIEPSIEKEQVKLDEEKDAQRAAWVKQAKANEKVAEKVELESKGNQVESDEVFTAEQRDVKPVVPPEIETKYHRVGDKFYHPMNKDLVAFEDKGNKLETKSNSEQIAGSMVRIAEARGWDEIKVSGSETFRREVWLEAASRGMHVKGYKPNERDLEELEKRSPGNKLEKGKENFRARENETKEPSKTINVPNDSKFAKEVNKSFDARASTLAKESPEAAVKKHPELAGAVVAMSAIDKRAEADGYNPQQRAVIAARVKQNMVHAAERNDLPEVKIKEEVEVQRERSTDREPSR